MTVSLNHTNSMPTAEQHSLKRVMAFPSNLFPPRTKCKHQSNVVLNQMAHSEDLRLPSSGSIECLQSSPANQLCYDFCRYSVCSVSYFKRINGWWCVPNHQLHKPSAPSHKSNRLENRNARCHSSVFLLLRSNFHIYLYLSISIFFKFQHNRFPCNKWWS